MYSTVNKRWLLNHVINSREENLELQKHWNKTNKRPFERIFILGIGSIKVAAHAKVRYDGPQQTELYFHAMSGGLEDFMMSGFAKYMLGHQNMPTYKQVKDFFINELKLEGIDFDKPIAPKQTSMFDFVA